MKYSSVTEINSITVDDVIIELMSRLLDLSSLPLGTHFYNLLPDEGQELYDRIQVHILLVKPTMEELGFELSVYKLELLDNFDETAAERERVEALENRFAALIDLRMAMSRIGRKDANLKAFKLDTIINNDTDILEQLEAENAIYLPIKASEDLIDNAIKNGKEKKAVCDECLDAIRGYNSAAQLTRAEIRQNKTMFSDLHEALQDGSPNLAREDLEAASSEQFDDLKVMLLRILSKRGF